MGKHQRQLRMCYLRKAPSPCFIPEGYSVCNYSSPSEKIEYVNCCRNGLSEENDGEEWFDKHVASYKDCVPEKDVFFIKKGNEYVASICAIFHPTGKTGYIHMVGIRSDFRGKGLSALLNYLAVKKLYEQGAERIWLTTDDWRVPAIKGYLKVGFIPECHGVLPGMVKDSKKRWGKLYKDFGKTEGGEMVYLRRFRIKFKAE